MLSLILKKDQFDIDVREDCINIRKLAQKRDASREPTENPTKEYTAVETSTPHFQELKQNLEKLTNKPKAEDLKNSRGPTSVEKKEATSSPNTDNGSKQASGGPRKSWVLASSTPQTKAFEESNLTTSQNLDSDEKPQENKETPVSKTNPEEDSKVYKIKDNPFVRGSTPTKNPPTETRKSVTTSREAVVTKRTVEERQVSVRQETTALSSSTTTATSKAAYRHSVVPGGPKTAEPEARRSSVGPAKANDKSADAKKPAAVAKPERPRSPVPASEKSGKGLKGSVADGWHSLEYENGTYEGDIKANKRHGKGRYTWKDGNWYEGAWVDDVKEGMGKFVWTTGDSYEGEYKKDKRHGAGIKIYANGDKYEVLSFHSRENGPTETKKVEDFTPLPMETCTTGCSRTTRKRVSASRRGRTGLGTRATGKTTRCTAKARSSGTRATSTRAATRTASAKARAPRAGRPAPSTP
jgi:hypothetical protein